ncbi:hypothetical protein ACIGNX_18765 [Actinosynnema sp. NPDC053489]|uniref:hypothetical protein n=1 Tax=Actinosynnema sp. NPDC053489 TaxID=3363916 RepID=UPI0037CA7030
MATGWHPGRRIAVVGRIARDLVLVVPEVPATGGSAGVLERREMLGGKGADIARGTRQLGATAALVGVVGTTGRAACWSSGSTRTA